MKFGVNYTPRVGWFHSWLDFEPQQVRDDFAAIKEIGADHVRIFPLWPILQPNRTLIRSSAIDDVVQTVQIAGEFGLKASVDVLQGHLSSFDFVPAWALSWHRRNMFTNPDVVSGEVNLVAELARALRGLDNTTGLTVGNEFIQFAAERHPDPDIISEDEAAVWLETLLAKAREEWPDGEHVHCHDDDLWFENSQPFTPSIGANIGDLTTVHSWVFGRIGPRFGKDTPQLPWFGRYLVELAHAWNPGRRVWLQEIGAPDNYVSEHLAPEFLLQTVGNLMGENGGGVAPGLEAITWWCSHDVSRELSDFPPLEHTLGLIDQNGNPKPIGDAFAHSATQWRDKRYEPTSRESVTFGDSPWKRSETDATGKLFDRWIEAAMSGNVLAIELNQTTYVKDLERSFNKLEKASFLSTTA
ncbi:MAG: hypothetical protein Q4D87_08290 [Actinomycetaceae bacterium]|nr:hypothetical protein [Actinomycetaceae bacterium]